MSFLKNALLQGLMAAQPKCEVPGCKHHSLGMVCGTCSRVVCQDHHLLRPALPPEPVCHICLVDELDVEVRRWLKAGWQPKDAEPVIVEATIVEEPPK